METKSSEITIEHQPNPEKLQKLGVYSWDIWTKEASKFPWKYDYQEICYFLDGDNHCGWEKVIWLHFLQGCLVPGKSKAM